MNPIIATTLRAILKIGGGYFVAQGLADEAGLEIAISALVALIGFIWGVCERSTAKKAALHSVIIAGLIAFAFSGGGCATAEKYALVKIIQPPTTNAITGTIQPAATNYAVAPALQNIIATGQAAAPLAPPPFDLIITAALTMLGSGVTAWAVTKNLKANPVK